MKKYYIMGQQCKYAPTLPNCQKPNKDLNNVNYRNIYCYIYKVPLGETKASLKYLRVHNQLLALIPLFSSPHDSWVYIWASEDILSSRAPVYIWLYSLFTCSPESSPHDLNKLRGQRFMTQSDLPICKRVRRVIILLLLRLY